jgi:hypothetical protein
VPQRGRTLRLWRSLRVAVLLGLTSQAVAQHVTPRFARLIVHEVRGIVYAYQ